MKYYAGIGSRETPLSVCADMTRIAVSLRKKGYILRSGRARMADTAFEEGALRRAELFTKEDADEASLEHAAKYHPAWERVSAVGQQLHARNSKIILGESLRTPVEFVVCWTPDGKASGGTGQGIRVAEAYGIPVFNLAGDGYNQLKEFIGEGLR